MTSFLWLVTPPANGILDIIIGCPLLSAICQFAKGQIGNGIASPDINRQAWQTFPMARKRRVLFSKSDGKIGGLKNFWFVI
jgi:hypothetical protein